MIRLHPVMPANPGIHVFVAKIVGWATARVVASPRGQDRAGAVAHAYRPASAILPTLRERAT